MLEYTNESGAGADAEHSGLPAVAQQLEKSIRDDGQLKPPLLPSKKIRD